MVVNTRGGWAVWMSLAIGQNLKLNQTRPRAAFEERGKKGSKYDSAKFFCWRSTSQPKCCVTARNIILIYYLTLPAPSTGSQNALGAPARLETPSGRTVDHSSVQEMTPGSHKDSAVEMRLILLSVVARGRSRGMKKKSKSISLVFLLTPNHLPLQIARRERSTPSSDSPANGVVFKTVITNSLLLILQQQGLKLCLLSNWEPLASGPNQSELLTAFLAGRIKSKTALLYRVGHLLCVQFQITLISDSPKICGVGKMSGCNECQGFPTLSLVRKWMLSLSCATFKRIMPHIQDGVLKLLSVTVTFKNGEKKKKTFSYLAPLHPLASPPPLPSTHGSAHKSN